MQVSWLERCPGNPDLRIDERSPEVFLAKMMKWLSCFSQNYSRKSQPPKEVGLTLLLAREESGIGSHGLSQSPNRHILDDYEKLGGDWSVHERQFLDLMKSRRIEENTSRETLDGSCLFCSEEKIGRAH